MLNTVQKIYQQQPQAIADMKGFFSINFVYKLRLLMSAKASIKLRIKNKLGIILLGERLRLVELAGERKGAMLQK